MTESSNSQQTSNSETGVYNVISSESTVKLKCTNNTTSTSEESSRSDNESRENSIPTSESADYVQIIREKNNEIKNLKKENKNLRKMCAELNQQKVREQELVEELNRYVETVENLRSKICLYEQQIEQLQNKHLTRRISNEQKNLIVKSNDNVKINENNQIGFDDVSAALNLFVEKNRNLLNDTSSNTEEDVVQTNLTECLVNLVQGCQYESDVKMLGLDDDTLSQNMLSLLLNTQNVSLENGLSQNVNNFAETNLNNKSKKSFTNFNIPTVREYVNEKKDQQIKNNVYSSPTSGSNCSTNSLSATNINSTNSKNRLTTSTINGYSLNETLAKPSTSGANLNSITSNRLHNSSQPSTTSTTRSFTAEEQKIISRMQEIVAKNVENLGDQPLNTIEIAKQCKRLMVAYNIGQRLFAKAVMCQVVKSQGSLSELLSKPRTWFKLTDKGREAFRRIFGWLSDDKAIELLCQLSPRRVAMPCDKIEHPEPSSLLNYGDQDYSNINSSKIDTSSISNFNELNNSLNETEISKNSLVLDEQKKSESDVELKSKYPQTNIIITKMLTTPDRLTNGTSLPQILTNNNQNNFNGVVNRNNATIQQTRANSRWRHDDISTEKIINILEMVKEDVKHQGQNKSVVNENHSSSTTSNEDYASPKSIHSIILNNNSTNRLKIEPPPIVQEQFEKYSHLDTEDVVRQIKDYLSRHSTSQRQFGENVLGLSQGSVSDLLARPKAWSMLTHKGREPFIRMKMFLDEHANDEVPPPHLNPAICNDEKSDGLNYGMEEEFRETPESETLYKHILEQIKWESSNGVEPIYYNQNPLESDIPFHEQKPFINKITNLDTPIDTFEVSRKIKEFLSFNAISQRAFGEYVMGMTSGSVSDLLCRPKVWSALSAKGKESYTKMANFLQDEQAIAAFRLHALASLSLTQNMPHSEMTVRDILTTDVYSAIAAGNNGGNIRRNDIDQKNLSDISYNLKNKNFSTKRKANDSFSGAPSNKRLPRFQRAIITDSQKEALFFVFSHEQRPSTKTIEQLGKILDLSTRTVTNWFHNYRTRQKAKEVKLASEAAANGLSVAPLKPNPLQVEDPTTKSWFKKVSELLSQSASSISNDQHDYSQNFNKSGNEATEKKNNINTYKNVENKIVVSDFLKQFKTNTDEEENTTVQISKSSCNTEGGALDKVIARISCRLTGSPP